ncbi:hypothetical protein Goshw_024363 [Gossypium schwendimanii]|uniref:Uncharacterized protein n=1 Tax=Gossypium schwendimanii TaxID=34291 RepID=A0A7J9KYU8_GOSSC|nr:hypothetical protein [Gossypium schwendimanii]
MEGKTSGKGKEIVLDETESESFGEQFKAEVPEEVDGEGLNDSVGKEEDGNKTEYFDSDDHGSILGLEDDDNTNICRRRSRFPTYNPNLASPHFCIGMLFKDGNFLQEFTILWDYVDELRLKNPRSTIKITVNRVTPHSPTHFKRFYVCFEALKRCWKEGCRPILGLDGCFLKCPFKGKLLVVGLEIAINDILLKVEHRNCARHVLSN